MRERQTAERFLAVLEKNPRRGTVLDRVYGYHVEHGTLDALIKAYQDRTAQRPERRSRPGCCWACSKPQRGRDAAAVAALRQAEAARPDDPLASYYLGQTLVLVGQPDAAAEAFERAIARKPARADLLQIFQALGRVHQRAYHTDKALDVWARLEALFPDDLPGAGADRRDARRGVRARARALPRFEALAKKATDPYRQVQFRIEAAELKVRLGRTGRGAARLRGAARRTRSPRAGSTATCGTGSRTFSSATTTRPALAAYYERWLKTPPRRRRGDGPAGPDAGRAGPSAEARRVARQRGEACPRRARSCGWP